MQLRLTNFKCYSDGCFTLDKGVTLIEGESGKGKSTIFEGVYYALYGEVKNPYAYNHKTCAVELLIGDLRVLRQSGPAKLEVEVKIGDERKTYSDQAGQDMIDTRYGIATEFVSTSYLKQNSRCVLLNSQEKGKMKLLRSVSLGNNNIEDLEKKLSRYKKDKTDESLKVIATMQTFHSLIVDFQSKNQPLLDYMSQANSNPKLESCTEELFTTETSTLQDRRLKTDAKLVKLSSKLQLVKQLDSEMQSKTQDLGSLLGAGINPDEVNQTKASFNAERLVVESKIASHAENAVRWAAFSE